MDSELKGYDFYFKLLTETFQRGHLAHSILFSGISGQGKSIFARQLAYFFLTHATNVQEEDYTDVLETDNKYANLLDLTGDPIPAKTTMATTAETTTERLGFFLPDPQNRTYKRMESNGHPDYMYINAAEENNIKIEKIHNIIEFSHKTPVLSTVRVVIIDDFNKLNNNASNAILKLLEEPPINLYLMLISHNADELLPTIVSRCLHFKIPNLPYETWSVELQQLNHNFHVLTAEQTQSLYSLSQGSIGHALEILNSDFVQITAELLAILQETPLNYLRLVKFTGQLNDTNCSITLVQAILNQLINRNLKMLTGVITPDKHYIFSHDVLGLYQLAANNRQNLRLINNLYMSDKQMFASLIYRFKKAHI